MSALLTAVAAVQNEAPALPKDKTNPHFKNRYTSLDKIVELVVPLLGKHGLVWTALPAGTHDQPALAYKLAHAETGEALEGTMPLLLDKSTAQGFGSAITYARRYALCAVLNLVADEDDDGSAATRRTEPAAPQIIGSAECAGLGDEIRVLIGADADRDKDLLKNFWMFVRGDRERPTADSARVIGALYAARELVIERDVTETFSATEEPPA